MKVMISAVSLAALVERASRLVHSIGYAEGLYPAQWMALRYFTEAPPSARTAASLARYQGMSLGPVARTIRSLVDRGLLARAANPMSRRADLIAVTATGLTVLKLDPRAAIAAVVETLPDEQREVLAVAMEIVLTGLLTGSAFAERTRDDEGGAV